MIDPMIPNTDQYDILIVDDTPDRLGLTICRQLAMLMDGYEATRHLRQWKAKAQLESVE